jgi:serine/threonine-protein kinase
VSHPNLVGIFDMDFDHDPPFIAMEFLDGPTLARELKKGAFSEARALAVAEQSLRALAALHAVGIVHRDIKPGNIMLVSVGGIEATKVVDLGIAQLMTGTVYQKLTSTGAIIGTPAYMSPEMLEGATATAACDVWAIGIVLFSLLTGRKPFADADLAELVQSVLEPTPAPDVRTFAPSVSPQTARFVGALLEKSLQQRPATASEALLLLEQLREAPRPSLAPRPRESLPSETGQSLEPQTLEAPVDPPSTVTQAAPRANRARWLVLGLVGGFAFLIACVVLLGFGVAAYAWHARSESLAAAPAPAPAAPVPDGGGDACERAVACCRALYVAYGRPPASECNFYTSLPARAGAGAYRTCAESIDSNRQSLARYRPSAATPAACR